MVPPLLLQRQPPLLLVFLLAPLRLRLRERVDDAQRLLAQPARLPLLPAAPAPAPLQGPITLPSPRPVLPLLLPLPAALSPAARAGAGRGRGAAALVAVQGGGAPPVRLKAPWLGWGWGCVGTYDATRSYRPIDMGPPLLAAKRPTPRVEQVQQRQGHTRTWTTPNARARARCCHLPWLLGLPTWH